MARKRGFRSDITTRDGMRPYFVGKHGPLRPYFSSENPCGPTFCGPTFGLLPCFGPAGICVALVFQIDFESRAAKPDAYFSYPESF